jgi:hypothetical protein|tara:strand:- start:943 stop:1287 length:345 start_codon:yes stop_codon:yes gene_type:complete
MSESGVKDKRGNVIISPGLKVRHKDSQFEYTVDQVFEEPGGSVTIMLAAPEEPRFEPSGEEDVLSDGKKEKVLYETEPIRSLADLFYMPDDEDTKDDDLLAVSSEEFEKEYEVK